jgi:alkanesulfonate monooxygenase SsuD/methylene tetrahydromethanopterin reductase-like flavin-dependent oxidoreductase (luciferase family)
MRYGIFIPNFGPFGDARVMAELAASAEAAGWDGAFVWDHVVRREGDFDLVDPWVALTAMAMATTLVTIGPLITPLPRRRPWNVAKSAVSIDHLSGGRMVLGIGLGASRGPEFAAFDEEVDPRRRGDMLDEGVALVRAAWTGEPVHHEGEHYQVDGIRFLPRPVRDGRLPIWAATEAATGRAVRRAAGLDGIFPIGITPSDLPRLVDVLEAAGPRRADYDIVVAGTDDAATWDGTAATWWLQELPWQEPLEVTMRIVGEGPPGPKSG